MLVLKDMAPARVVAVTLFLGHWVFFVDYLVPINCVKPVLIAIIPGIEIYFS
jgi:hypothetical protein